MTSLLLAMVLLPLGGSILNGLVLRSPFPRRAGVVGSLFAAASFVCAVTLWWGLLRSSAPVEISFPWFKAGVLDLRWGFRFDWLTAVMSLVVTGIGTLIHVYSIGYMADDRTPSRYFAYLNLFLFAMLSLITADNLPGIFVGWEGVGLCSYLLIGYWYHDLLKADAGMKAFIVNRIGDAGFLLGIFLCFQMFNSVHIGTMAAEIAKNSDWNLPLLNMAALCLFVGAMGKSAQIPLFVWLPDAMAGPTPVSALIHAATMVTAGIYLVCRMRFLFLVTADTNSFMAMIGVATAVFAALIATAQRDIKKVLAYSTVSQLGLMFLALGCRAYVAALFHVVTHAFFKALLFLGAGSVIHALGGEQDITKMGGLAKKLPWTFWTFAIATLALCGIPPLAGFFSKDSILFETLSAGGKTLWILGLFASTLTSFYMARLFALVFFGKYRGSAHPHESPAVMLIPLGLLAVGSALGGFLNVPEGMHFLPPILERFVEPNLPLLAIEAHPFISEWSAMGLATSLALGAIAIGLWLFAQPDWHESTSTLVRPFKTIFENKFWIDELYDLVLVRPFQLLAKFLARFVDGRVIDATLIFPARIARFSGSILSFVQAGATQFYLLVMLLGALLLLWISVKGMVIG